jgi:hypothetical protein
MLFLLLLLRRLVPELVSEGFRELLHAEWVDQLQPSNIIVLLYEQFCFLKNILFQLLKYKAQQISSAKNACAVKMAALFEALGLTSSANH